MQPIDIWHKFYLYRAKIIFVICLPMLLTTIVFGQGGDVIYNPNYDSRKVITYGFSIGLHTSSFQMNYSQAFVDKLDSVHSIAPKWSLGFSLGFIINANMSEYLDFMLTPRVSFYEYKLEYNFLNAPQRVEVEESTVVELPLLVKYKSARRMNTRLYFIGGLTPGFEASGTSDLAENADLLQIERFNVMLEIGFGLDKYYPLFKFSPEIRFSKGLVNLLSDKKNDLSEGIDRLNTNVIALYFHFQ